MSISSNSAKKTSEERFVLFIVLSLLAGVIFSCIFEYFILRGFFTHWEIVGKVPENMQEVVGGSPVRAYIRTGENKIQSCNLDNGDECWIPDVYDDLDYTQACDKKHVAFSPALHPPEDLISCIDVATGGGYHYDVLYGADRARNLWQWAYVREGSDTPLIMLMALAGGLGGFLLGSILWVIQRLFRLRKATRERPLFSRTQIVLLAIPWLYLLIFLVMRFLITNFNHSASPEQLARHTQAASTETARQTETAQKFVAQITPGAGNLRYSFSDHPCDAKWNAEQETVSCLSAPSSSGLAVRTQFISTIGGMKIEGKALVLPTGSLAYLYGEYPVIEIQPGDHFRASIACLPDSMDCTMDFTIYLYRLDKPATRLGEWRPGVDNPVEEIDLDLTRFAGERIRFAFSASKSDFKHDGQDILWISPRIEK